MEFSCPLQKKKNRESVLPCKAMAQSQVISTLVLGYLKITVQIAAVFPTPIFFLPQFLHFADIISFFSLPSYLNDITPYPSSIFFLSLLTAPFLFDVFYETSPANIPPLLCTAN